MQDKLSNWVIFPRYLIEEYLRGVLTRKELFVLMFIRGNADPYGVTKTSLDALAYDMKEKKNNLTKIVHALKRKRYIDFESRPGSRGTFSIHLDYWRLPDKSIKDRWVFYTSSEIRGQNKTASARMPSSSVSSQVQNQRLNDIKTIGDVGFSAVSNALGIRGTNNDTNNDTDTHKRDEKTHNNEKGLESTAKAKGPYYDPVRKMIIENP